MLKIYINNLKIENIFILTFLFIFIFTPRLFMPFSLIHILTIISLTLLLKKYQKTIIGIVIYSKLTVFITLQIILIFYTLAVNSLTLGDYTTTYWAASTILEILPCAIYISIILLSKNIDSNKIYDIILIIGIVQVVFVIISFLSPVLRDWMLASSGFKNLIEIYDVYGRFRVYGLSVGYAYSMPLFQGLCVIVAYVLGTFRSPRYFYLIPFYLFSIALNARIGLISIFVVPVIIFLLEIKKRPLKRIVNIGFVSFLIFIVVQVVQYQAQKSASLNVWVWLNAGINEIINFKNGVAEGNLSYLSGPMWFIPRGIDLLIGSGDKVFGRGYQSSDVGYIINLHYGGLIYSMLLYFSYLWLILKYSNNNIIEKAINISVVIYLLLSNLKGDVFMPNEIIKGVLLLIVYSLTAQHIQKKRLGEASV